MASFQKPQSLKAALKIGLYGPAGSGKTFSALLLAEGLAKHTGKRIAFCDTEQGTAFYSQDVPQRPVHPQAFDFDVLHTKSITDVLDALRGLDAKTHSVVVIDSITHLWESCKNAFTGNPTRAGTIPLHAWSAIKRPYKELMHFLLGSPLHVLICGRQGIDYGEDESSGELKHLGYRMRAEGETAYEPDVLLRLEAHKANRKQPAIPVAHVEKDRTGILAGQSLPWPTFDKIAKPLLGLLGTTQVAQRSDDEVGQQDAEALAKREAQQRRRSQALAKEHVERFLAAETAADLQQAGQKLTEAVKKQIFAADLERVRQAYAARLALLQKAVTELELGANGTPASAEPALAG